MQIKATRLQNPEKVLSVGYQDGVQTTTRMNTKQPRQHLTIVIRMTQKTMMTTEVRL